MDKRKRNATVTHSSLQRQPLLLPDLLLKTKVGPQRTLRRRLVAQEPINLLPLPWGELDLVTPLLHPFGVGLQFVHEVLQRARQFRIRRSLGVTSEVDDRRYDDLRESYRQAEVGVELEDEMSQFLHHPVSEDPRLLILLRRADVVFPIQRTERRSLGPEAGFEFRAVENVEEVR